MGETLSHTVAREVKEETGINVEVTGLIGVYSDPMYVIAYPDGIVAQDFSVCFHARPFGGQIRVSTESREVRWVAPEQVDTLTISPAGRLRIRHGLDANELLYYT